METLKKLPIGIEFFKDFKAENYYYVDKTGLIRDLMNAKGSVNLFTKPRRFGKSLNMDMLGILISEEAGRFSFLLESDRLIPAEKKKLSRLIEGDFEKAAYLHNSLKLLTQLLCKHYGTPWDVINQCDKLKTAGDAKMEPYWVNSSSNAIIQDLIEEATEATKADIEALISGESVEKKLIPELTYTDLESKDKEIRQTYLWSVLFAAGYLTEIGGTDTGLHRLVIPNKEVLGIYEQKILS